MTTAPPVYRPTPTTVTQFKTAPAGAPRPALPPPVYRPASVTFAPLKAAQFTGTAQPKTPGVSPQRVSPEIRARPAAGHPGVVQRDIGFEFEVGDVDSRHPIVPAGHRRLTKGELILTGPGYTLQGEDANGGAGSSVEFVTNAFPESKAGRNQVKQTLRAMKRVMARLSQAVPEDQYASANQLTGAGVTAVNAPQAEIQNIRNPTANPQVTGAIRLDRIHDYVSTFGAQPGEARALMAPGRTASMTNLTARVQTAALYFNAQVHVQPSQELKGVLSLVGNYLEGARGANTLPYVKSLAQMLLRTDFGTTFNMVPEGPTRNNTMTLAVWLECARLAGGTGNLDDVLLSGQNPLAGHLTIRQWLTGLYNGQDLLTRNTYPVAAYRNELESMGSMGPHTENVTEEPAHFWQRGRTIAAPVIEIRTLQRGVPVDEWEEVALDLFDNIRRINQKRAYPGLKAPNFRWAVERHNQVGLATRTWNWVFG